MLKSIAALTALFTISTLTFAQAAESLLIGPGDLVHVQVFDTPEMDQRVRVTDSGVVPLAFVGDVKLLNLTPADAAHSIERALVDKKFMLHPNVNVTVEQYATQNVSVLGQVHNPGLFPITTPQSIVKVLSLAGGLTEVADRSITIERHGEASKQIRYYLSNSAEKAFEAGVMVNPGDTVIVPKTGIIYVLGDVARPGGYPIATNDSRLTMLQALAMAGSANKTSVSSKIRLIRRTAQGGQQELPVQLAAMEQGKQADLTLQPDDVIYIPFSWMKNMAMSASTIAGQTGSAAIYLAR